jgi:hypothetical protein
MTYFFYQDISFSFCLWISIFLYFFSCWLYNCSWRVHLTRKFRRYRQLIQQLPLQLVLMNKKDLVIHHRHHQSGVPQSYPINCNTLSSLWQSNHHFTTQLLRITLRNAWLAQGSTPIMPTHHRLIIHLTLLSLLAQVHHHAVIFRVPNHLHPRNWWWTFHHPFHLLLKFPHNLQQAEAAYL